MTSRDTRLDQWGDPARLPEELRAVLDPERTLAPGVTFFAERPQPWLTGAVALPFAAAFLIGALVIGPLRLVLGHELSSPALLTSLGLSALLTLPALILLFHWRKELRDHRERASGRWRRGVFLTPSFLLVHLGPERALAVRRQALLDVESLLTPDDPPTQEPRLALRWERGPGDVQRLVFAETLDIPRRELAARLEAWIAGRRD